MQYLLLRSRWPVAISLTVIIASILVGGCPPAPPPPTADNIGLQLVADGLTAPVDLAAPPDGSGRLFVVDQPGRIRVIDAGGGLLPTPFLDVADRVVSLSAAYDERGLLGMAFHPDYASNGRFFVFYNPNNGAMITGWDMNVRVSEFHVSGDPSVADAGSEIVLLTVGKPQGNHNGGQLAFDPDGFLLFGIGDGGGAGDSGDGHNPTIGNAQDKTTLLGKILRINVNAGSPYGIPADNPFVAEAGARPEIYVLGARNPWRFSFDSGGERRLFVADVGQNLFEEVSIAAKGDNLGWRIREGAGCFDPADSNNPPAQCANTAADGEPLIPPILQYPHSDSSGGPSGIAVIGGFVYRGGAIPGLTGRYVFGDWSKGFLFPDGSLFVGTEAGDGSWTMEHLTVRDRSGGRIGEFLLGMGRDMAGELYLLSSANSGPTGNTGKVYKVVP
ncbi:MAG TPA: PQQ-dependent sugar dehydrogenase [Phycisphaerae bacterium]|nr:PQQ-dependent sugar dehydrogenase [Phycisphaerae bacterium]